MDEPLKTKYQDYPKAIRTQMYALRKLVLDVAKQDKIGDLRERLKWGEPSFITKCGSTVRVDWKQKSPESIFVFFHCATKLVDTFREVYPDSFEYSGNRAIVLPAGKPYPVKPLKHCISMALNYHKLKHLPLLGA